MYKFKAYDRLKINMTRLVKMFMRYHITAIFVFDGKPPPEKNAVIRCRHRSKCEAERRYCLLDAMLSEDLCLDDKDKITKEMEILRKQMVRIGADDNKLVRGIFDTHNIQYITAEGEADRLCAEMLCDGRAWACLSDDMDMFIYGCPRVMRHISLRDDTVIFYETDKILQELGMDLATFRRMLVLTGTDYNKGNGDVFMSDQWANEYIAMMKGVNDPVDFYEWIANDKKTIIDRTVLERTCNMFTFDSASNT